MKDKFSVLSLDRIYGEKNIGESKSSNKPVCFLTFDDGWKDFYENAYPILQFFQTPATVFLPTDFIGSKECLWTDKLTFLIVENEKRNMKHNKKGKHINEQINIIDNMEGPADHKIEKSIFILKSLSSEQIESVIHALAEYWQIDPNSHERMFLSWEEVMEMRRSGIVTFGSHTKTHRILTTASEDQIREELILSKGKLLEKCVVSPEFIPFAYPNGDHNPDIAKMVEEAGYSLAVTTCKGWNRRSVQDRNNYQLNRIGLHQDITATNSMLACRIYGIY
jgi:peptidoglycan/xylan/chitin deacetylase (PgdA/CDA1 family)